MVIKVVVFTRSFSKHAGELLGLIVDSKHWPRGGSIIGFASSIASPGSCLGALSK